MQEDQIKLLTHLSGEGCYMHSATHNTTRLSAFSLLLNEVLVLRKMEMQVYIFIFALNEGGNVRGTATIQVGLSFCTTSHSQVSHMTDIT